MYLPDVIGCLTALSDPEQRTRAERTLALALGAEDMVLLVADPDIGALVPVPGGRHSTLPSGMEWRSLLDRCKAPGVHRGSVTWQGAVTQFAACSVRGVCAMLLGGKVRDAEAATLMGVLPLLGSALSAQHAAVVARGELAAARSELKQSSALMQALDHARHDVESALRKLDAQTRTLEKANRRAQESVQAKDEFLAMLGHELRNPLAPIFTVLQVLRMRGEWSAEHDIMFRQVEHMRRLVDDLLDVTRIASGKLTLQLETVSLETIATRAVESVAPLIAKRGHPLHVDVPACLHVVGDVRRLVQVLSNLLVNAAKYSDPGTPIALVARRNGNGAEIEVQDRGMGIEPAKLETIFDLFEQQKRGIDRAEGGLGLGLAIVRNVVQLHGGSVRAENRCDGPGSRFIVSLPLADAGPPARMAAPDVPARLAAPGRVLVVDDNVDAARTLAMVLESTGFEVRTAHDGYTAVDIAREFAPSAAVLDIGLPGMDGYELAAALRRDDATIPLVALTGYGQPSDRSRAVQAGFAVHFVKPVDPGALCNALDEGIRSRSTARSTARSSVDHPPGDSRS